MINAITKNKNIIIWYLIYSIFIYMSFRESIIRLGGVCFYDFMTASLFGAQRMFFTVSIFFFSYLFILKKPFNSPMFITRSSRETYFFHILFYGFKICFFYIALTIASYHIIPLLLNIDVMFCFSFVLSFANKFSFIFTNYLFYIIILMLSNKQLLSVLSSFAANLILFMLYFILQAVNEPISNVLENIMLSSYTGFAIILAIVCFIISKRKDFIS